MPTIFKETVPQQARPIPKLYRISQAIGHIIITIMATIGLGNLQEADNQLDLAAETYRRVLQLAGDPPLPVACEAHLGLARICLRMERYGCRFTARAAERPTGAADREHGQIHFLRGVSRPSEACPGRCGRRGRYSS